MDALRLIKTARHALSEARTPSEVLLEAWQTGLLIKAVGTRIAERGGAEVAALGELLAEAGAHTVACIGRPPDDPAPDDPAPDDSAPAGRPPVDWTGGVRAGRLAGIGELEPVLHELGSLLHEVAESLVVLACTADAESVYWQCIDGVDAGAECKDLVSELLRTVRRQSGSTSGREAAPEAGGDGAGAYGRTNATRRTADVQDPADVASPPPRTAPDIGRAAGRAAGRCGAPSVAVATAGCQR